MHRQSGAHYGLRLWRRPLSETEVQRYVGMVARDGTSAEELDLGLQYALAGLLQSPNFLYVAQVGEPDPASGFLRYTSWEMARFGASADGKAANERPRAAERIHIGEKPLAQHRFADVDELKRRLDPIEWCTPFSRSMPSASA